VKVRLEGGRIRGLMQNDCREVTPGA